MAITRMRSIVSKLLLQSKVTAFVSFKSRGRRGRLSMLNVKGIVYQAREELLTMKNVFYLNSPFQLRPRLTCATQKYQDDLN